MALAPASQLDIRRHAYLDALLPEPPPLITAAEDAVLKRVRIQP